MLDEGGFGLAMSFVQSKTMRDTAAMLDCLAGSFIHDVSQGERRRGKKKRKAPTERCNRHKSL